MCIHVIFPEQCCSFPDNTSQVMFHKGSGFGDDDEDADEEEVSVHTIQYCSNKTLSTPTP